MKINDFHPVESGGLDLPPNTAGSVDWWEKAMKPVYDQLRNLSDLSQKRVTLGDNLNTDVKSLSLEDGVEVIFRCNVTGKPLGATLLWWDNFGPVAFSSAIVDTDRLRVKATFTPTPTKPVACKILVWGP